MAEERAFGPVRLIPGANKGRYPHSNSVYIEGAGVLIDTGADEARYRALLAGPGIKEVWLSHWHEDHLKYLDLFEGLPLRMMADDAEPLTGIEAFLDCYGMPQEEYRDYWRRVLAADFHFKPRRPTRFFAPGEIIDLGTCTAEVIHAPGHTPGFTAFFFSARAPTKRPSTRTNRFVSGICDQAGEGSSWGGCRGRRLRPAARRIPLL